MKAFLFTIIAASASAQSIYVPNGTSGSTSNPTSGSVGIGTATPSAKLHVVGDPLGSSPGATTKLLTLQNGNANNSFLNVVQIRNGSGADWYTATTRVVQVTDASNQGYIDFNPVGGAWGMAFGSQQSEYVRIQVGGNVGIGTTTPPQQLSITGGIGFANQNAIDKKLWSPTDGVLRWTTNNFAGSHAFEVSHQDATVYWHLDTTGSSYYIGGGNIGIGTTNPTYPLSVNGTVRAKEVIVDTAWSDYVLDEGYKLAPLSEVERRIKIDKHLPGIPSAQEVAEHGISMGEMQAKLLAKIEELTLHQIEMQKTLTKQQQEIRSLRERLK